jgi:hypothetical protein
MTSALEGMVDSRSRHCQSISQKGDFCVMDVFFELHSDNPREGPGSFESTQLAFSMVPEPRHWIYAFSPLLKLLW